MTEGTINIFYPKYYTTKEGGVWKKFNLELAVTKELLDNCVIGRPNPLVDGAAPCDKCMLALPIDEEGRVQAPIHSLAFGDYTTPRGGFPRWDCINGWTTTFQDIEEQDSGV